MYYLNDEIQKKDDKMDQLREDCRKLREKEVRVPDKHTTTCSPSPGPQTPL